MTEHVRRIYQHLHAELHRRKHWKRSWVKLNYGCYNYARLKPDDDGVVHIGYMSQPYGKNKTDRYYKRFNDNHLFAQMRPTIELHPNHALLGLCYGAPQTIAFDWPAIAKEYKLNLDEFEFKDEPHTYNTTCVDISLNNVINYYLKLKIYVTGAHLRNLRRYQWFHHNKAQFKTCGPAQYDYDTCELTAVRGDYTKTVDEPARLKLNRTVRKAMQKIRALSRFSEGIETEDLRTHFLNSLPEPDSPTSIADFINHRVNPHTVLESLEKMELHDKNSVHDAMLNVSLTYTKVHNPYCLEMYVNPPGIFAKSAIQHAPHRGNTTSSGLAWLRQYLQLETGVVEYRPE